MSVACRNQWSPSVAKVKQTNKQTWIVVALRSPPRLVFSKPFGFSVTKHWSLINHPSWLIRAYSCRLSCRPTRFFSRKHLTLHLFNSNLYRLWFIDFIEVWSLVLVLGLQAPKGFRYCWESYLTCADKFPCAIVFSICSVAPSYRGSQWLDFANVSWTRFGNDARDIRLWWTFNWHSFSASNRHH